MKILDSAVTMSSNRAYESRTVSESKAVLQVSDGANAMEKLAAVYERSGGSMVSAVETYQRQQARNAQVQPGTLEAQVQSGTQELQARTETGNVQWGASNYRDVIREIQAEIRNRLLETLKGVSGLNSLKLGEMKRGFVLDLRSSSFQLSDTRARLFGADAEEVPAAGTSQSGTLWTRITAVSGAREERETTSFQSKGFAVTEDGRAFHFDAAFSMSRSFTENYDALKSEQFVMMDPLMIQLDSNAPSVSGAKFDFDLDADGVTERISFAGDGSGFLALDANENGVIDDGSELFGTKSGDGFADLAAYDDDGNGWIDENDAVYSKLRVWTRGADGHDKLLTLQEADVGAVYLGSTDTQFSLNDAVTNETEAVVRRTGVYLKESGGAGTVSHVDLRC